MLMIAQKELQSMLSRRQRHLRACLASPEMDVVEVAGNLPVKGRKRRIDEQMVMTGIRFLRTGRGNVHAGNTEFDRRTWL